MLEHCQRGGEGLWRSPGVGERGRCEGEREMRGRKGKKKKKKKDARERERDRREGRTSDRIEHKAVG